MGRCRLAYFVIISFPGRTAAALCSVAQYTSASERDVNVGHLSHVILANDYTCFERFYWRYYGRTCGSGAIEMWLKLV
ncbi:hypothetical protein BDR07DRAFT_1074316 [Suillus spraguei]|nr:hypothetical protein BDR07DRAFT_1074316 [Suillus spraguei]